MNVPPECKIHSPPYLGMRSIKHMEADKHLLQFFSIGRRGPTIHGGCTIIMVESHILVSGTIVDKWNITEYVDNFSTK
jgi:hypothetical protein